MLVLSIELVADYASLLVNCHLIPSRRNVYFRGSIDVVIDKKIAKIC